MVERERAHDVNEAARRFAQALAESYRVVYGHAAESQERHGDGDQQLEADSGPVGAVAFVEGGPEIGARHIEI